MCLCAFELNVDFSDYINIPFKLYLPVSYRVCVCVFSVNSRHVWCFLYHMMSASNCMGNIMVMEICFKAGLPFLAK